jgi:hypothetical protein
LGESGVLRLGAAEIEVDNSENMLDNVTARFTAKPVRI